MSPEEAVGDRLEGNGRGHRDLGGVLEASKVCGQRTLDVRLAHARGPAELAEDLPVDELATLDADGAILPFDEVGEVALVRRSEGAGVDAEGLGDALDAVGFVDVAADEEGRDGAADPVGDGLTADGGAVEQAVEGGGAGRGVAEPDVGTRGVEEAEAAVGLVFGPLVGEAEGGGAGAAEAGDAEAGEGDDAPVDVDGGGVGKVGDVVVARDEGEGDAWEGGEDLAEHAVDAVALGAGGLEGEVAGEEDQVGGGVGDELEDATEGAALAVDVAEEEEAHGLLVAEGFDGPEAGGLDGGVHAEEDAGAGGEGEAEPDGPGGDGGRG